MDLFNSFHKAKKSKPSAPEKVEKMPIKTSLNENLGQIKETLGNTNDLLIRELALKGVNDIKVAVLGIDGLINTDFAHQFVLHVLAVDMSIIDEKAPKSHEAAFDLIFESRISMIDANTSADFDTLHSNLLNGHVIVLIDGVARFMYFDCKGWAARSIGEPNSEKSLWGPKDSFVETIRFNTATLRRKIRDSRLRFDTHIVGKVSKTDVFVAYIEGITNPEFVRIANERIKKIDIDTISSTTELIQLIQDKHHTVLPRLTETERPDRTAKALAEGQVAIFVDGSPYVILGPFYFTMAFSAIDDYYNHPIFATFKRVMRYLAYFAVILIPGFYIAISTFHQEMIPTSLLITIINQRSSNPFSTFIEILVIIILFEILREASLRKPDVIGDSMTIVGSLIIGQTIVESGLVSYAAIIVGSVTTISSFLISSSRISVSARVFSLLFMVVGASFGLYGITLSFIMLITHISSITSFGQAYLAPLAPFNLADQKDQLFKLPIWKMKTRPKILKPLDSVRQGPGNNTHGGDN